MCFFVFIISDKKVENCKYIDTYKSLLEIAKVKKLWYVKGKLHYEG